METRSIDLRLVLAVIVPTLIISTVCVLSTLPAVIEKSNIMGPALAFDLILIAPLSYFFLSRKSGSWKLLTVPVLIIAVVIGMNVLPADGINILQNFKNYALPLVELGILTAVIWKVRQLIRGIRANRQNQLDVLEILSLASGEILPKPIARLLAMELAMIYYGFVHWKSPTIKSNQFTHHKKSGTPALLGAFLLIIGAETAGLHFLLGQWNATVAWILTILSIYTGIQVFGIARSMTKRFHEIQNGKLVLRYGMLATSTIPLDQISTVVKSAIRLTPEQKALKLSPLGDLERHNVVIHLKTPVEIQGLYGKPRTALIIGLHVDDPEAFITGLGDVGVEP